MDASTDGSSGPQPSRNELKRQIFFKRFRESFSDDTWNALDQGFKSPHDFPSTASAVLTLAATHAARVISDHDLFFRDDILSRHELLVRAIPLVQALRSADWGLTMSFPDKRGLATATTTDAAAERCFGMWYNGGYYYERPDFRTKMDPETIAAARFLMTIASSVHYSHIIQSMAESHIPSEMATQEELDIQDNDPDITVEGDREMDGSKEKDEGRKRGPVLQLATPSSEGMTNPGLDLDVSDASPLSDVDESYFADLDLSDASSLSDGDETQFVGMGWQ